ncbi:hypothetical protein HGRIS_013417 [Hohenbuehelia grisea]|uniref:Uncharacterized protein n=1 Tax=Hohenbuehelia grisea TaxID=104357 RepID=A0ABR3IVJ5_9AGAR
MTLMPYRSVSTGDWRRRLISSNEIDGLSLNSSHSTYMLLTLRFMASRHPPQDADMSLPMNAFALMHMNHAEDFNTKFRYFFLARWILDGLGPFVHCAEPRLPARRALRQDQLPLKRDYEWKVDVPSMSGCK